MFKLLQKLYLKLKVVKSDTKNNNLPTFTKVYSVSVPDALCI